MRPRSRPTTKKKNSPPLPSSPQLYDYLASVTPSRAAAAAGLTRSEAAAVANHCPRAEVDAYALVPDLDARPAAGAGPLLTAVASLVEASEAALRDARQAAAEARE